MKEILFSFDNNYGLSVKDIQFLLRGKKGFITVDVRPAGMCIVRRSDTQEEALQPNPPLVSKYCGIHDVEYPYTNSCPICDLLE